MYLDTSLGTTPHFNICNMIQSTSFLLLVHFDRVEKPVNFAEGSRVASNEVIASLRLAATLAVLVPPRLVNLSTAEVGVDDLRFVSDVVPHSRKTGVQSWYLRLTMVCFLKNLLMLHWLDDLAVSKDTNGALQPDGLGLPEVMSAGILDLEKYQIFSAVDSI